MSVKSISSGSVPVDGTHYMLVSNGTVVMYDIEGNVNSTTATAYYIQLLNTNAPTSGTTVPLYSRLVVPAAAPTGINGFSFVYRTNGISVNGPVYVAISSTDTVYTSVAATTNVTATIEDGTLPPGNSGSGGGMQTYSSPGASFHSIWADPSTGQKIYTVTAKNQSAGDAWLALICTFNAPTGTKPAGIWFVPAGQTITLDFGSDGFAPQTTDANGVLHTGCTFRGSSTSPLFTVTPTTWVLTATYK